MEQIELETAISELEERVERLRVLYDQYFNGFEKIEPLIPRKDVERRVWLLRREQIRNTGLRFRFNQIVSRLNTFGMYWGRILRQIEAGTFKRDLIKAEKRFGSDALAAVGKKKGKKKDATLVDDGPKTQPPASTPMLDATDDRMGTVPGGFSPAPGTLAPPAAAFAPSLRPKSATKLDLDLDLDDDDDELFAGLEVGAPPPPARGMPAPPPPRAPMPSAPAPRAPMPSAPAPRAPMPSAPAARAPMPSAPAPDSGPRSTPSVPARAAPASDPRPPQGPASAPRVPAAAPAQPIVRSGLAGSSPFGGVRSGLAGNLPRPQAATPAPAPAPAPKPAPAPAAAPAPKPAATGGLAPERVQDLFTKYVAAKKQCNEPTHTITTEALEKTLRESAAKLRQKHGKDVDFDVVVKDGKAIFKPVLKG